MTLFSVSVSLSLSLSLPLFLSLLSLEERLHGDTARGLSAIQKDSHQELN
jgi:hypothetical protein